jgi:hypothetical protein
MTEKTLRRFLSSLDKLCIEIECAINRGANFDGMLFMPFIKYSKDHTEILRISRAEETYCFSVKSVNMLKEIKDFSSKIDNPITKKAVSAIDNFLERIRDFFILRMGGPCLFSKCTNYYLYNFPAHLIDDDTKSFCKNLRNYFVVLNSSSMSDYDDLSYPSYLKNFISFYNAIGLGKHGKIMEDLYNRKIAIGKEWLSSLKIVKYENGALNCKKFSGSISSVCSDSPMISILSPKSDNGKNKFGVAPELFSDQLFPFGNKSRDSDYREDIFLFYRYFSSIAVVDDILFGNRDIFNKLFHDYCNAFCDFINSGMLKTFGYFVLPCKDYKGRRLFPFYIPNFCFEKDSTFASCTSLFKTLYVSPNTPTNNKYFFKVLRYMGYSKSKIKAIKLAIMVA